MLTALIFLSSSYFLAEISHHSYSQNKSKINERHHFLLICQVAGQFCEKDIDECTMGNHLCLNGGTCINKAGGYKCICVNGWEGENCSINKDDCVDALCEAGSTCVDHVAKYTCECPPGRIGPFFKSILTI